METTLDTKGALLAVAARLFAGLGWRGTTTRRVAAAAGVNEVTVFRHFGSKETLLQEAVAWSAAQDEFSPLPEVPGDVRTELVAWAAAQHAIVQRKRAMMRTCLAEFEEHPGLARVACAKPMRSMEDAVRYLAAAQAAGTLPPAAALEGPVAMLMHSIFMDGMTRDVLPGCSPVAADEAIGIYVDVVLRALGATEAA
ncbi:MAG: TetR/AcrR family transcriptional regulator [Phycisphaerales bacterium]